MVLDRTGCIDRCRYILAADCYSREGHTKVQGMATTVSTNDREYMRRHGMVADARGKAKQHKCEHCSGQAFDWATIYGTDGSRPEDYMPLCRSCHIAYDGTSHTGLKRSEETKRKLSESHTGKKIPKAQREAMAASQQKRRERERSSGIALDTTNLIRDSLGRFARWAK